MIDFLRVKTTEIARGDRMNNCSRSSGGIRESEALPGAYGGGETSFQDGCSLKLKMKIFIFIPRITLTCLRMPVEGVACKEASVQAGSRQTLKACAGWISSLSRYLFHEPGNVLEYLIDSAEIMGELTRYVVSTVENQRGTLELTEFG